MIIVLRPDHKPEQALWDGNQSLESERFAGLLAQLAALARAVGRQLGRAP